LPDAGNNKIIVKKHAFTPAVFISVEPVSIELNANKPTAIELTPNKPAMPAAFFELERLRGFNFLRF